MKRRDFIKGLLATAAAAPAAACMPIVPKAEPFGLLKLIPAEPPKLVVGGIDHFGKAIWEVFDWPQPELIQVGERQFKEIRELRVSHTER